LAAIYETFAPEREFTEKIKRWERLKEAQKKLVAAGLRLQHRDDIQAFLNSLENAIKRKITVVIVIPLHGRRTECKGVDEAITFLTSYNSQILEGPVLKYEIGLRYSNGDKINAEFENKEDAIQFTARYK